MTNSDAPQRVAAWRRILIRHPLASFFVLACGLSWIGWIPYIISGHGLGLLDFRVGSNSTAQLTIMLPGAFMGPIGSAYFVTRVVEGKKGVRRWGGRFLKFKVNWRWYLMSVVGVPLLFILSGLPFSGGEIQPPPAMALVAYIPVLLMQYLTTGLAEEPGWRDFCLPRIQPYFGPLRGTLILGVVWGIWHLPMFITEWSDWPNWPWYDPFVFIGMCIVVSIVMTWVFNRTGGSLPIAILTHVSCNTMMSIVILDMFPAFPESPVMGHLMLLLGFGVWAAVLLIKTKGKLGYDPATAELPIDMQTPAARTGAEPAADARA
ncbi:type II CAAX endopeptidase family protein [Streptomonospora sediminis]